MKEGSTPRDLVVELKKVSKRRGSRPPGFEDWMMITEPIDVRVSKGSFERTLGFIEKFATEFSGYGLSFSPQKGELHAMSKTLGVIFLGHWLPIKISEGYVEDETTPPYKGTGLLRISIGENQRWEEGERVGELVTQIHSMLTWIHEEGGRAFFQGFEDKRAAEKLERQRIAEVELVHSHWINKAVAAQAENEAQSWQRATVIREYSAVLLEQAQGNPKSIKWALWLGKYADRIDPLTGELPAMPTVVGPFNWELQR
jgi:hypothetical protein